MIKLDNLECKAGSFTLHVDLTVHDGEYFVLLGPNGAGKTVLIETIAGFHKVTQGSIVANGADISLLPPEKRNCSLVYQDNALFPHMSVRDNITYGLRVRKYKESEITDRLSKIASFAGISDILNRKPEHLSGGEKRRVSLARALIVNPEILLLDEPLTALDPETRDRMLFELKNIQQQFGVTVLHVCHDFTEAVSLGTRIAVMNNGQIVQVSDADAIFRKPESEFVARFTMAKNIFKGQTMKTGDGTHVFQTGGLELHVNGTDIGAGFAAIRPENIMLGREESGESNCLKGRITRVLDRGNVIEVTVSVPPDFVCQATRIQKDSGLLEPGNEIYLSFLPDSVSLFPE